MGCCLSYPAPDKPLRAARVDGTTTVKLDEFDGALLAYTFEGAENKGPLVVCLHGVLGFRSQYSPFMASLVPLGYRMLSMDFYGWGESDLPFVKTYDENFYIAQVSLLLNKLNLSNTRVTLVGHSLGGAVAVCYAAAYPQIVDNLVLIAPAGFMNIPCSCCKSNRCLCDSACCYSEYCLSCPCNMCIGFGCQYGNPCGHCKFLYNRGRFGSWLIRNNPGIFSGFVLAIRDFPFEDIEKEATIVGANKDLPVLIIWGTRDGCAYNGVAYSDNVRFRKHIPQSVLWTFKGYHHGVFMEKDMATNRLIRRFLEKLPLSTEEVGVEESNHSRKDNTNYIEQKNQI